MVKTFTGVVTDAETDAPLQGVHVWPLATRSGGVVTDQDGEYNLAIDDGSDSYIQPWIIESPDENYGSFVIDAGKYLNGLDIQIYKTDASVVTKAKAIIKNSLLGFLVTVMIVSLLIKVAQKYI